MTGDARLNFEVKGDLMQEKGIRTRAKSKKGASVPGHAMFFCKASTSRGILYNNDYHDPDVCISFFF